MKLVASTERREKVLAKERSLQLERALCSIQSQPSWLGGPAMFPPITSTQSTVLPIMLSAQQNRTTFEKCSVDSIEIPAYLK